MMRRQNISSKEQRNTHTLFNVISVFLFGGLHCFLKLIAILAIPLHLGATIPKTKRTLHDTTSHKKNNVKEAAFLKNKPNN